MRPGHFLSCADALSELGNSVERLTDLKDLPSRDEPNKKEARELTKRDERVAKANKLKSWDGKKVWGTVTCFDCAKPRCIYSATDDAYATALLVLQQKLESVSHRFCYGDLLFDDVHHLAGILAQKQSLTCESPMEKGYFNCKDRRLQLHDVCYHCGTGGSSEYILGARELKAKNLTGGYDDCFPICVPCLGKKKKVVTKGRNNALEARRQKTANTKKG